MHDEETAYYITDGSLAEMAEELSSTSPPLLTLERDAPTGPSVLRGSVTLTDAGRAVLASREDRVALCGLDRWLGGVHLESGGRVWRWDDARQRITPDPPS